MRVSARLAACGVAAALAAPVLAQGATSIVPLACRALADSRTLSAALPGTLFGDAQSFERVQASSVAIDQMAASDFGASDPALHQLLLTMGRNAEFLLQRRELVMHDLERIHAISLASSDLLEQSELLSSALLMNGGTSAETSAALQAAMLSQRIGRSADRLVGWDGISPESVFLLGKDLHTMGTILDGFRNGDSSLRLRAQRLPDIRKPVDKALAIQSTMQAAAQAILDSLRDLAGARQAQVTLQVEADQLGHALAMACAGSDASAPGPWRAPAPATPAPPAARP